MLPRHLVVYPWDLDAASMEQVLDHLHGEIGFTGISLACAVPPVTELRARPAEPRCFRTEGGLCVTPAAGKYDGTRLEPTACAEVPAGTCARIAQSCRKRKLALRLVVSTTQLGGLSSRNPWAANCNVYGDVSRRSVCLLNANVQAFLAVLLADLNAQLAPQEIVLADYHAAWSEAMGHELDVGVASDTGTRSLLSMCFCPSCHQGAEAAGVDVSAVKTTVTGLLARSFDASGGALPGWEDLLAEHSALDAYNHWRGAALGALWRRLAQASEADLLLFRSSARVARSHLGGLDWSPPAAVVSELCAADELTAAFCEGARRNVLHLSARVAAKLAPDPLVALLVQAAEAHWQGVEVGRYGQLGDTLLESLRRALRFARRSAEVS